MYIRYRLSLAAALLLVSTLFLGACSKEAPVPQTAAEAGKTSPQTTADVAAKDDNDDDAEDLLRNMAADKDDAATAAAIDKEMSEGGANSAELEADLEADAADADKGDRAAVAVQEDELEDVEDPDLDTDDM